MSEASLRAGDLIALIEDLDAGLDADSSTRTPYLELMRGNATGEESGTSDRAATQIVRRLLRERLGSFPLEELGAAVLARIDARVAS